MVKPVILWFRQDLRLADHAALIAACADGPVIPVYILDDISPSDRKMGAAQRWWLHHSLDRLSEQLRGHGLKLILRRGDAAAEIAQLAAQSDAVRVHAHMQYEPWWKTADGKLSKHIELVLHDGNFLVPPGLLKTGGGAGYRIFTPFWRALLGHMPPPLPMKTPEYMTGYAGALHSDRLGDWNLRPTQPDWATGFDIWTPGEAGAHTALQEFLPDVVRYDDRRNLPSESGTSRLSPHLHFGEISPTTIWHRAFKGAKARAEPFLRQIGWRDYAANIIDAFPDYATQNGRSPYDLMPWRRGDEADADFTAWTKGLTGYPIVDAGMRELWSTGWMHNRVRMIAASFLIKHLLIDWRRGERWFWNTLVDADYASNAINWQWIAGTGIDSNMFSRIMAPLLQSEKFDAGDYIRKWVPELRDISDAFIHNPENWGMIRPQNYPHFLIGHRAARVRAMEALSTIRH